MKSSDPVSVLPSVGAKRSLSLSKKGIETISDLLTYYPRNYSDRSKITEIEQLTVSETGTIRGYVSAPAEIVRTGQITIVRLMIFDNTGSIELVWFNQPYLRSTFSVGKEYIFTGRITAFRGRLKMEAPEFECTDNMHLLSQGRIVPIYSLAKNLTQQFFRRILFDVLNKPDADILLPENLPVSVMSRYDLCERKYAVRNIHFPESEDAFYRARKRLVFEELFFMQYALFDIKDSARKPTEYVFSDFDIAPLTREFGYEPTDAQKAAITDILSDFMSGLAANRLVQGDVGSGKTFVASAAAYLAIKNGYQAAFMAPTDVLARQHFLSLSKLFIPLGCDVTLLVGDMPAAERRAAIAKIKDGSAQLVVGTHALFQSGVLYKSLALVITDEQHRFGVKQRQTLSEKSESPHVLIMSATPIPRTLALILYGDLDISVINSLPPGRQHIDTFFVDGSYRERIHKFIKKEIDKGHQAFIVCATIGGEQPSEGLKSVVSYAKEYFPPGTGITAQILHGKQSAAEKQAIMQSFSDNDIHVLISTTVVEVGVDIPNATVMLIEDADRFGLSQLHQLRGRVGRGSSKSYCILISDTKSKPAKERLTAMTQTNSGFELSETDLRIRGPGDFFGTAQHGLPVLRIANLYTDTDILKDVSEAVMSVRDGTISIMPAEQDALHRHCKIYETLL